MNASLLPAAALLVLAACATHALAKLPAPSDEAKAKAAETAAKNAHGDKVAGYKLCLSQERVAQVYLAAHKTDAKAPVATPPCADPGPFVYVPPGAASAPAGAAPAPAAAPAKTAAATAAAAPAKK